MNDLTTRINRIVPLIAVLFAFIPCLHAQDISDTLREIKVLDARKQQISNDERINNFSPGQKVSSIDSITLLQYRAQQVSALLTQQVPVFVRSYGFNNLATLNFRGSSAAQSLVLWNGVPLVYAALGMTDVSLLPVSLVNKVNIVYGGSAALWGSGNVGGAVLLEDNAPVFDTLPEAHMSAMLAAGSYSRYNGDIKASFSNRKWFVSANAFGQTAVNDFAYTDTFKHLDKTMDNAHLRGAGGVLRAAYKIAPQNILSLTAWYQHYYREIPPALFETVSYKQQQDASLRLLLDWKRERESSTLYAKSAFIRDDINYKDSALSIVTDNISYQLYEELGWKHKLGVHQQFLVFTPVTIAWMQQLITHVTKQQTKAAIAAAYSLSLAHSKLHFAINARSEAVNANSFLLPGADASFELSKWLTIRANAQRTYRVPTLGELYTFPGGDSSLKPEQGWTEDVGYTVKTNLGEYVSFYHDLSYFNRNINDWIIWFGGAIWTPHNIASVHSRGMETENRLLLTAGKWQFHAGLNTAYILAVTTASYIPGDSSIGKQIPYTPRYNGQVNIGFAYKGLYLNYNHTYTGYRFYTTDESAYIPPYNTGNIQASYSARLGIPFTAFASCNNIWGRQYQVVSARPMPGANWLIGLRADIL